jgi:vancomycin resistance protein VanW
VVALASVGRLCLAFVCLVSLMAPAVAADGPTTPATLARALDAPMLIGHFTTDYPHSAPDRNFNMALAMSKLRGTVVPAGGVFSFNGTIGDANRANGYRKGRVFVGDRIVEGYGGGICQVASTLYNAAVRAGLPMVERHLHGLTVPYLTPGEDATISYGALDLSFRNDTGGPLFIWGEAVGGRVTVDIYGVRPGPEVWFEHRVLSRTAPYTVTVPTRDLPKGERRVAFAGQEGLAVHTWLNERWEDGRVRRRDLGVHVYRASPRIVEVGV